MIDCPRCGTANEAARKFCGECGGRLAAVCPSCSTANPPSAKFCGECATPLGGQAVPGGAQPQIAPAPRTPSPLPSPAPSPVAERRLVSVLFADLVGFTPFAAERDAEEVRETLSRYFEIATQVVTRYGGTIEKFIGDAVMAIWGAPITREDDAELAVRAALELVDAVRALGPTISARAGVLTGEAAVTLGALNQGMVAGDIVNTAARLQSVAQPGTVLVGEPTMRAASAAIVFAAAGEQELKGKAAPVPAWRALRIVAEVGGRNRVDGLEAPFVGRDDEMRELKELFHGSARERRVRLVSVIGPAGIGKSRLAWEFLKYMDGLIDTTWWHQGRSPAHGQGMSFWALGEMIRGRCGLLEGDDERTSREKVASTLAQHVADPSERQWIEPALLALLGFGSGASSDQLFAAWRTFFERLAATAPVVMVFEDLQWADTGTLDFIDHLLDWSRGLPVLVLTLARPDLLDRRPTWGAAKRSFASIHLDPLPEPAMRALLAGLVPGLPEGAVRSIVARADGMPLYAVETVRMLLAEGRLEADGDAYRVVGDLSALAVPETLTALIGARLDALDPADRALLQDAAVLGQSFTLGALAAITALDEAAVGPRLRALVRRELLILDADPRSPERGQYAFVQALIREVAYNTLARRDRKTKHLAAARWFESVGSDELAGALAGHYLAARDNAGESPEADALAAQARVALRAAADRAVALGSPTQAMGFLEDALTVTPDAAEEAAICERIARLAAAAARHSEGMAHGTRALDLYRSLGDGTGTLRAATALTSVLLGSRRFTDAIELIETTSADHPDLARTPDHIALQAQLVRAFTFSDRGREVLEVADRTLEAAERADLPAIIADLLVSRGTALNNLGRYREGTATLRAAIALAEAEGVDATRVRGYNNLAASSGELDPQASAAFLGPAIDLARRLGQHSLLVMLVAVRANVALRTGEAWQAAADVVEGMLQDETDPATRNQLINGVITLRAAMGGDVSSRLAEMIQIAGEAPEADASSMLADARGTIAFVRGELTDAQRWLVESHRIASYPPSLILAARAAVMTGDPEAARSHLALFDETGAHGPTFHAGRAGIVAGLLGLDGETAAALAAYREARRRWVALGLAFDLAVSAIEMAAVIDPAEPEVAAAVDEAREAFRRMGAVAPLALLERTAAREVPPARSLPSHAATTIDLSLPSD